MFFTIDESVVKSSQRAFVIADDILTVDEQLRSKLFGRRDGRIRHDRSDESVDHFN